MVKEKVWLSLFILVLVTVANEACDCRGFSCSFMKSEKSCAHYCFCPSSDQGTIITPRKCPGNLKFNPKIMNCDDPENFQCDDVEIDPDFRCVTEFHPFEGSCERFIQCSNGYPSLKKCPSSLHWSQSSSRCEYPETAGCETTKIPPCKHGEFYPDPKSCGSFFVCSHNKMISMLCPSGQHFCMNCKDQGCVYPYDSDCMITYEVVPNYFAGSNRVKIVSPFFESANGTDTMNCPLPDGVYSVPADPSLYLMCRWGQGAFFQCPPRNIFDPEHGNCIMEDVRPWNRMLSTAQCNAMS